jgi:hypothetical protein
MFAGKIKDGLAEETSEKLLDMGGERVLKCYQIEN